MKAKNDVRYSIVFTEEELKAIYGFIDKAVDVDKLNLDAHTSRLLDLILEMEIEGV